MGDNISPEEKLLRLIKGQKKIFPVPAAKLHLELASPEKFSFNFNRQKIITLAFIIGGVYLLSALAYPFIAPKKIVLPQTDAKGQGGLNLDLGEGKKPIEFYEQQISSRNIFGGAKEGGVAGAAASGVNIDLAKEINLVGIISGEPRQAVIEDIKTKKTYYVSRGQFIGEYQVEDIQEGKIIVNYKGAKYELYM